MSTEEGRAPSLHRAVGLPGAVLLGLGSIVGTGVFVSLAVVAGVAADGLLLTVVVAAMVAGCNGLSSAQLAAAHPVSGGTYEYGYRFLHPLAGFAAGWLFLVAKSASAATAALGVVSYGLALFGVDAPGRVASIGLTAGSVLVVSALAASGLERSSKANAVIVGATLLSLLLFVVLGAVHGVLSLERLTPSLARSFDEGPAALAHGVALAFVAFTGYGRVATLGEEVKAPSRTIPRAVVVALLVSALLYASVAATALGAVGANAFAAFVERTAAPLEEVATAFGSPLARVTIAIGAVTAMLGVLLNLVLGLSRVALAMARRGDLPRGLSLVDERKGPRRAVWATGLVVAALSAVGDVALTWSLSAFTVLVYYALTNAAALRVPKEQRRLPRAISWLGFASCAALALFVEWRVLLAGTLVVALATLARALVRRRRAKAWPGEA